MAGDDFSKLSKENANNIDKGSIISKIKSKKHWIKWVGYSGGILLTLAIAVVLLSRKDNITLGNNRAEYMQNDLAIAMDPSIYINGKQYVPIGPDMVMEYGFEEVISEENIGELLGNVSEGNFKDKEVYQYIPANCDAVVVMKDNDQYQLYSFISFDSYINNQDEDMIEYLKVYGINSYNDIEKVVIAGNDIDSSDIETFYNYFSSLKNSSDEYFESLANYDDGSREEPIIDNGYNTNMPTVEDPLGAPISNDTQYRETPATTENVSSSDEVISNNNDHTNTSSNDEAADTQDSNAGQLGQIQPNVMPIMPVETILNGNGGVTSNATDNDGVTTNVIGDDNMVNEESPNGSSVGSEPVAVPGVSEGNTGSYAGTNALTNCYSIRVYSKNGLFFEMPYYSNIEFISRHKVNEEFKVLLRSYL